MAETSHFMEHVKDAHFFELPLGLELSVPQPFEAVGIPFHVTKFMALEIVVGLLMLAIFIPLARRIARGGPPKGLFWNFFEAILLFLRDEVTRPAIGGRDADRFLPFIWTLFFFILFCNLMGLVPWAGSLTGAISTTAALAAISFCAVVGAGMWKMGVWGFFLNQIPTMDLPLVMAIFLKPMILGIELLGLGIKHFVLAVRLMANIFAGHLVLAVIMGFIAETADRKIWYIVVPASILGTVALSLLELFVAFLQAYIFTFLSALFIGMTIHKH